MDSLNNYKTNPNRPITEVKLVNGASSEALSVLLPWASAPLSAPGGSLSPNSGVTR